MLEFDINYFFIENIPSEMIFATTTYGPKVKGCSLNEVGLGEVSLLP